MSGNILFYSVCLTYGYLSGSNFPTTAKGIQVTVLINTVKHDLLISYFVIYSKILTIYKTLDIVN